MSLPHATQRRQVIKRCLPGLIILAIALLPWFMDNSYILSSLIFIGIYSIVTISLCLLMGYAGQISLGHAAFYGLGAYGSAIFTVKYGVNPWLALMAAALVTALVAWAIGIPTLKLKEHYLALATLGFGIIVYIIFTQESAWTGGPFGLDRHPLSQSGHF